MTINEAREKLNRGWILSHESFLHYENIRKVGNKLLDEDDNILNEADFFNFRKGEKWQTGWKLFAND